MRTTRVRLLVLYVVMSLVAAATVSAQDPPTASVRPAYAGDCLVMVGLSNAPAQTLVGLELNLGLLPAQRVTDPGAEVAFDVRAPLQVGDSLRVRLNGQVAGDALVQARPPTGTARRGTCDGARVTAPQSLAVSVFLGKVVDTFAPDDVGAYRNPDAARTAKLRDFFDVVFDYPLLNLGGDRELHLYAETLHGVRTADIDCAGTSPPPVCNENAPVLDRARYILEHASSLEAFASPYVTLATLQKDSETPSSVYLTVRFGFVALDNAPSVFNISHVGAGIAADGGPFVGSYFEIGVGNNELLRSTRWNRLKVDAFVKFPFNPYNLLERVFQAPDSTTLFFQMRVDNDLAGRSPDSIQTLFGLGFNIRNIVGR